MKCTQVEELTADYLAGNLSEPAVGELRSHLADCPRCHESMQTAQEMWRRLGALPEGQPSPALRLRVDAIIEAYRQGMERAEIDPAPRPGLREWLSGLWPRRPAFQFALVAAAFVAGSLVVPLWNLKASHGQAIVELRDEVAKLRQMVTLTLLEQPSANERLEGVSYSNQLESKDERVLNLLLQTLGSDPNVNVRVAAVGALRRYADSMAVRKGLLQSLAKEDSPLVQMELIDLMVGLREKDSIPVLEKILRKTDLNPTVRQQAERGLQQI